MKEPRPRDLSSSESIFTAKKIRELLHLNIKNPNAEESL
jgi:hypothetical protein